MAGHVAEEQRLAVRVQILVGQVGRLRTGIAEAIDLGGHGGVLLQIATIHLAEPLHEGEARLDLAIAAVRMALRVLAQKALERHKRSPPGHAVVADVDEAAGLEPARQEAADGLPVRLANPSIDTVQDDEVEARQAGIWPLRCLLEAGLVEGHILEPRRARQLLRVRDLRRQEVNTDEAALRIASREDVGGQPVPAAELGVRERPRRVRRTLPLEPRCKGQIARRQLSEKRIDVRDITDVAVRPVHTPYPSPAAPACPRLRLLRSPPSGTPLARHHMPRMAVMACPP